MQHVSLLLSLARLEMACATPSTPPHLRRSRGTLRVLCEPPAAPEAIFIAPGSLCYKRASWLLCKQRAACARRAAAPPTPDVCCVNGLSPGHIPAIQAQIRELEPSPRRRRVALEAVLTRMALLRIPQSGFRDGVAVVVDDGSHFSGFDERALERAVLLAHNASLRGL